MSRHCLLMLALLGLSFATACAPISAASGSPAATTTESELTVAAAADLQFAFTDIARLYEQRTGHRVTLVFGSTGQLTQQIENGAPYDMTAAANIEYIERLATQGLVLTDTVALYARGRIVLAVNRQAGVKIATPEDLLAPDIRHVAIANPAHAPYGVAAQQALEAVGVWDQVQPKLILGENVRQALQYIQSGDAEAGIIAISVANVPEIDWVFVDERLYAPIDQALAVVASTPRRELAQDFIRFINGTEGRPIMRKYGFLLPGELPPTSEP